MNSTIRGVIFDIGNTLMFLDEDFDQTTRQGALEMSEFLVSKGLELEPVQIADTFLAQRDTDYQLAYQSNTEKTCAHSLQRTLDDLAVPAAFASLIPEAVRTFFRLEEASWTAFPGSQSVLKQLYGRYRLSVFSNATDDDLIQRLVNRLEFRPWLAPVFSSAYLGIRKPRREAFMAVLNAWNLQPEEAVMVGDRLDADIIGGRDVGMRTVLVTADEPADNELLRQTVIPDGVIPVIDDLPALLESWDA